MEIIKNGQYLKVELAYDNADLAHLKEELESAIKNLDGIDEEVMRIAFDAIRPLDYQDIKY